MNQIDRRQFVRNLGVSTATLPFLVGLPSLGLATHVALSFCMDCTKVGVFKN